MGTADFLLFFDKLFDSVNGTSLDTGGKVLRRAVKKETEHHLFWIEALKVLDTIKFVRHNQGDFVPPSIKNWATTVKMFRYLWIQLEKRGYDYFKPRNFNQDPLENFFECIHAHGIRNVNPTPYSFIASFKTLLVNNYSSVHSPGANCEDDNDSSLTSLKRFLLEDVKIMEKDIIEDLPQLSVSSDMSSICSGNMKYVAGFVVRKILKTTKCSSCKKSLAERIADPDIVTEAKQYGKNALTMPGSAFHSAFVTCFLKLEIYLEKYCTNVNIKRQLVSVLNKQNFVLGCGKHNIQSNVIEIIVHFFILIWTKNVNKSLKGLDAYATKTSYNKIRLEACKKIEKGLRKKKKIEDMKKLKLLPL